MELLESIFGVVNSIIDVWMDWVLSLVLIQTGLALFGQGGDTIVLRDPPAPMCGILPFYPKLTFLQILDMEPLVSTIYLPLG